MSRSAVDECFDLLLGPLAAGNRMSEPGFEGAALALGLGDPPRRDDHVPVLVEEHEVALDLTVAVLDHLTKLSLT